MEEPIYHGDYSFNTGQVKTFHPVDFVMFAAILVISAGIGFYHAWADRKKKDMANYLVAGGNMNPIPVGMSLIASFLSAITLLGAPAEIYNYTLIYWWIGLGFLLVTAASAELYIPVFYNLKVTSAFEYIERRFGKGLRTAMSCTSVVHLCIYMSIVLYGPSLALNKVTGFSLWGSVIGVGAVCTVYTAAGGMKAVLWTDVFQVLMMFTGLLAILIKGSLVVGGFDAAWESAERAKRDVLADWSFDPTTRHSVWGMVIGQYFPWVALFGVNQAQVQRCMSCPTLKSAKFAMWMTFPGLVIVMYLSIAIGFYMSAFYEKCDPIKAGFVDKSDQLLPLFVMDVLSDVPGLPGLFVACLFSGSLSTISSGLNAISAMFMEDVIRPYVFPNIREYRARIASQVIALAFGVLCVAMTYVADKMGDILQGALTLHGVVGGSLLGVYTLGMFLPWANKWGAISGLISGLTFMCWMGFGKFIAKPPSVKSLKFTSNCNLTSFDEDRVAAVLRNYTAVAAVEAEKSWDYPLYEISYIWHGVIAVVLVVAVGMLVSACTGLTDPATLNPRLICSVPECVFPFNFLPEKIKKPLRFGVRHGSGDTMANGRAAEGQKMDIIQKTSLLEGSTRPI